MRFLPVRFKEDRYPKDAQGRPDLSYYTDPIEHYIKMHEQYIATSQGALGRAHDVDLSFKRRVYSTWGLIAKGEEAVPYAVALLRQVVPEAREDGAAILAELGKNGRIVDHLLGCLAVETDVTAKDSLLNALGRLKSKRAIPALAAIIRNESADGDTRWTAVESLGTIVRRRFLAQEDPVRAAIAWLASHSTSSGG